MRCFLAISLDELSNKFKFIQSTFSNYQIKFNSSYHLTLEFFENLSVDDINFVSSRLSTFKFDSFYFSFSKLGVFPKLSDPKILWVSSNDSRCITSIKNLQDALKKHLLINSQEKFVPHVTIARIRQLENKQSFAKKILNYHIEPFNIKIQKIIFYKSVLTTKYEHFPISKIELK